MIGMKVDFDLQITLMASALRWTPLSRPKKCFP
jgi:hypothetical protein